jgi:hypothetical protein
MAVLSWKGLRFTKIRNLLQYGKESGAGFAASSPNRLNAYLPLYHLMDRIGKRMDMGGGGGCDKPYDIF